MSVVQQTIFTEESPAAAAEVGGVVAAAREAQRRWADVPMRRRLRALRALRHRVAEAALDLAAAIESPSRTTAEKLASEVMPLADAIRFLERDAARLLRPRRYGARGRPAWLGRTGLEVRREPHGVVLVVAPANYPLFLAGVQAVQALAAGNAVLVKPAPGHAGPVLRLKALAGLGGFIDGALLAVLPEDVAAVGAAVEAGVEKVVVTGSAETGAAVLAGLAPHLVPATMELSGHDPVFVCPGADLDLAARCVAYGMKLNGGATCIAPRRVFVPRSMAKAMEAKLAALVGGACGFGGPGGLAAAAADEGLTGEAPPAVSVFPVDDMDQALALSGDCPYGLGAAVFGSGAEARRVAGRVNAGCVVVNDMIAPTADPRLPFGGRGRSGFGVTRGAEGLLAMTRVKAVVTRRGSLRPHLLASHEADAELFRQYLAAAHGGSLRARAGGVVGVVRMILRRGRAS